MILDPVRNYLLYGLSQLCLSVSWIKQVRGDREKGEEAINQLLLILATGQHSPTEGTQKQRWECGQLYVCTAVSCLSKCTVLSADGQKTLKSVSSNKVTQVFKVDEPVPEVIMA